MARSTGSAGIIVVDKPAGWTSHDVVGLVRRLAGTRRVGHAGTLDPDATGVLVVLVGQATRLSDEVMRGRKCYWTRISLGIRTTTDDAEGEIVSIGEVPEFDLETLQRLLARFIGTIEQQPPAYAAIKLAGTPAYKIARRGGDPTLAPRRVRIDGLGLRSFSREGIDLLVWCGHGTYIRALARDLGEALGCGAHMSRLRRLWSGTFGLEDAVTVERLRALAEAGTLDEAMQPLDAALVGWPAAVLGHEDVARAAVGVPVPIPVDDRPMATACRLYTQEGTLLGLARLDEAGVAWQPYKMFVGGREEIDVGL